jgi:hypothetical protein
VINEEIDVNPEDPDSTFLPSDRRKFCHDKPGDVASHDAALAAFEGRSGRPFINWKHVDGPLFVSSSGNCYWPTWWERFKIKRGWLTLEALDKELRQNPFKGLRFKRRL